MIDFSAGSRFFPSPSLPCAWIDEWRANEDQTNPTPAYETPSSYVLVYPRATSPSERINELPASASASPSHLFLLRKEAAGGGAGPRCSLARSVVSVTQTRLAAAVVKTLSGLDLSHNKGRGTRCSLLSAAPQRGPARLAGVHKFDGRPTVNRRLANAATLARRRNTCPDV